MSSFKKPFDTNDHKKFDSPAKKATIEYLKSCPNLRVVDSRINGEFGIDLSLFDEERRLGNLEVETKDDSRWRNPWTKTSFPWPDVNFLYRKVQHLKGRDDGYELKGLWILWNSEYKQHLVVKLRDIENLYNKALEIEKAGGPSALVHVANRVERDAQKNLSKKEPDLFLKIPMSIVHLNGLDKIINKYQRA